MAKTDIDDGERQQAYITYLNLGASRNLPDVAKMVSRPLRTIQDWAKVYNWDYRVRHDDRVRDIFAPAPGNPMMRMNIDTNTGTAMEKSEYRQLLGGLIRDFAERFRAGDVCIKTIYEFEKVVKLDMLLAGEATSRSNVNVEGNIDGAGTTINQYKVNVEQTINNNPKMRELIGEMWREYNGKNGTPGEGNTGNVDEDIIDVTADNNDVPVKGQLNSNNDDHGSVPIDYQNQNQNQNQNQDYRVKQPSGLINNISDYSNRLSTSASGGDTSIVAPIIATVPKSEIKGALGVIGKSMIGGGQE